MRKVTKIIGKHFLAREKKVCRNTDTDGRAVYLFSTRIVWHAVDDDTGEAVVCYTAAGEPTITTHERLNGIARIMGHDLVFYCKNHEAMCDVDGGPVRDYSSRTVVVMGLVSKELVAVYDA